MLGRLGRSEDGVVMIVAMAVLLILGIVTAVSVEAATQFSGTANRDAQSKRALEAADAGLQVATYRLNWLSPAKGDCISDHAYTPSPAGSSCGPYTQSLGNGASFTYYTTPVLSSSSSCAGLPITNTTVDQRCVTATGTVNGVVRRTQTRVAAWLGGPIFPLNGVVGLSSVSLYNSAVLNGTEASNGQITLKTGATATSTVLGPSAPPVAGQGASGAGTVTQRSQSQGPFVLSPVNPGNSASVNDNGRIVNGLASPQVSPYDSPSGSVSYTASNRTLSLGNSAALTLAGATYNFCSLSLGNNATITIAAGARTAIFIDSPARPGSGCPAGTGTLYMANGSNFINQAPGTAPGIAYDTTALQIYVYGWPSSYSSNANVVSFNNSVAFYGTIYAPQSTISVNNSAASYGNLAGNIVNFNNSGAFTADGTDLNIQSTTDGTFFRTAWHECQPQATNANDPQSGC
jgi:Tfp pilus assembly protein PilX